MKSYSLKDILETKEVDINQRGKWIFDEKHMTIDNKHYMSQGYFVELSRITNISELMKWILHLNKKPSEIDVSGFISILEQLAHKYFKEGLYMLFVVKNRTINWETKEENNEDTQL